MVSSLPAEFLDPHTPPEVVVTDQIRPRITDSTLGVPLGVPGPDLPSVPDPPRHALVTVGDSLTHGMSSGAVFHTDLSWPALVAQSLGVGLVVPAYRGPLDGLPLNIEALLRGVQGRFGDELNVLEMVQLPFELHSLADANEDYWERGDGSRPPRTDLRYENVGIYGWDVRDCLSSTAARAMARIASHPAHDDLLGAKPDNDNDIAAASVLAPFGSAAAQIDAVTSHGHDGGIGTLVVLLGANNALGSAVRKSVVWSGPGFQDLDRKGAYTVWNRGQPREPWGEMAGRFTLFPLLHRPLDRGTGLPPRQEPQHHPSAGAGHRLCDRPVQRRHPGPCPQGPRRRARLAPARPVRDSARRRLPPLPRRSGRQRRTARLAAVPSARPHRRPRHPLLPLGRDRTAPGGLFGLDAVHPTTAGYGVIAQAVLDVLNSAGVASPGIDFTQLLAQDTLNSDPPALFTRIFTLLAPFLTRLASAPA